MKRLLFLCSGNYYRSRYAEEVFNHKAQATSMDWRADSRGLRLNPNNRGPIAKVVLNRLARLEIKPIHAERNPQAVRRADLAESDLIIAMSRREHYEPTRRMFPSYADQIAYWDVEDTAILPPEFAFQRIESLVEQLIDHLGAAGRSGQA